MGHNQQTYSLPVDRRATSGWRGQCLLLPQGGGRGEARQLLSASVDGSWHRVMLVLVAMVECAEVALLEQDVIAGVPLTPMH